MDAPYRDYRSRLVFFQGLDNYRTMYKFNKASVYRGRAYDLAVCYLDELSNQIPTNGLTSHYLKVQLQDLSWLDKLCGSGFGWGLQLNQTYLGVFSFTKEETALFKIGPNQSVFLKLCYGENIIYQEIKSYLFVYPEIF